MKSLFPEIPIEIGTRRAQETGVFLADRLHATARWMDTCARCLRAIIGKDELDEDSL